MTTGIGVGGAQGAADIARDDFGVTPAGQRVAAYTLRNGRGMEVRFIEYGGIVVAIRVPDRDGRIEDVTLGYETLAEYVEDASYLGVLVGRYANRIARGRFTLDGRAYQLALNDGPNHLHGGARGFGKVLWKVEPFRDGGRTGAELSYLSPDGEEGYPGALDCRVRYTLTDDNALILDFAATSDRATHVNLSQHSYFNLAGALRSPSVEDHELTLHASHFTPVDPTLIPTGERRAVRGTPFDFRRPTPIGARIDQADEQLRIGGGYDHNFVLDGAGGTEARAAARVRDPGSGRVLEVLNTAPGLQFYSGNSLGKETGRHGTRVFARRCGFCLEAQHFPDSPNLPEFPSTVLRPGGEYRARTVYRFSVERRP